MNAFVTYRSFMQTTFSMAMTLISLVSIGCSWLSATQPTELRASHRDGQTFLTWKEPRPRVSTESVTVGELKKLLKEGSQKGPKTTYRVYRSVRPITTLNGLRPIGEAESLSCWNKIPWTGARVTPDQEPALRFVIEEGQAALAAGTGLYVHNPNVKQSTIAYYAVTSVEDDKEDKSLGMDNVLQSGVNEVPGIGTPVLQSEEFRDEFQFARVQPTLQYYVRWESPPNANRENMPNDLLVAIPTKVDRPTALGLHLHCSGGSPSGGYGWWYNASKGSILLAPNQDPYDWWTGYHENYGIKPRSQRDWANGVVHPYTHRRILSLTEWAVNKWKLNPESTFVAGNSMGGSGSLMLAIRHPEHFAWAISWVGVHVPHLSPEFKISYARVFGDPEWNVRFEDGTPVWDYFNDAWYLRKYPERETPFISFSNGKNDAAIGWEQAFEFVQALQETKRPHLFVWGQAGHIQRAVMPMTLDQQLNPLDIQINQSVPAFTHCSLDDAIGDGHPNDGAPSGGINLYLYWETEQIVDTADSWEMTVGLIDKSPEIECTVDLTPRRLQELKLRPGQTLRWSNSIGNTRVQSGKVTVDANGLATLEGLQVSKKGNRIRLERF